MSLWLTVVQYSDITTFIHLFGSYSVNIIRWVSVLSKKINDKLVKLFTVEILFLNDLQEIWHFYTVINCNWTSGSEQHLQIWAEPLSIVCSIVSKRKYFCYYDKIIVTPRLIWLSSWQKFTSLMLMVNNKWLQYQMLYVGKCLWSQLKHESKCIFNFLQNFV